MVEYFTKGNKVTCVLTDRETKEVTVGRAKCNPDDEFDLEYGKQVAFNRAKLKEAEKNAKYVKVTITEIAKEADELTAKYVGILTRIYDRQDEARKELIRLEQRYAK